MLSVGLGFESIVAMFVLGGHSGRFQNPAADHASLPTLCLEACLPPVFFWYHAADHLTPRSTSVLFCGSAKLLVQIQTSTRRWIWKGRDAVYEFPAGVRPGGGSILPSRGGSIIPLLLSQRSVVWAKKGEREAACDSMKCCSDPSGCSQHHSKEEAVLDLGTHPPWF